MTNEGRDKKEKCNINREAAKILALSSGKIDKNDKKSHRRRNIIFQSKSNYRTS